MWSRRIGPPFVKPKKKELCPVVRFEDGPDLHRVIMQEE